MKDIYVVEAVPLIFVYDRRDGSYDAIKLSSVADVQRLIDSLERAKLVLDSRPSYLEIVEPDNEKQAIPQKPSQKISPEIDLALRSQIPSESDQE